MTRKRIAEFIMLFGSAILILGFFVAADNPVIKVVGFALLAAGFLGRKFG